MGVGAGVGEPADGFLGIGVLGKEEIIRMDGETGLRPRFLFGGRTRRRIRRGQRGERRGRQRL